MPGGRRLLGHAPEFGRDARLHRDPDRFDPGRWDTDGASVRPVVSSTLVPSELPVVVTGRS
jgi:cytochrome P450